MWCVLNTCDFIQSRTHAACPVFWRHVAEHTPQPGLCSDDRWRNTLHSLGCVLSCSHTTIQNQIYVTCGLWSQLTRQDAVSNAFALCSGHRREYVSVMCCEHSTVHIIKYDSDKLWKQCYQCSDTEKSFILSDLCRVVRRRRKTQTPELKRQIRRK